MAMQWPIDKLSIIQRACVVTRNYAPNVLEDGSDEYAVCSPAYEDALAVMLEEHGWVHATKVVANLPRSPTAPTDTQFDAAYPVPADCLHLIWVRQNDVPALYSVLAGQIVVRLVGAGTVSIKYVSMDNSDVQQGATPLFVRALTMFVMAALYSGLEGDKAAGAKAFANAEAMLQRAKTRSDQQKPKQSLFNSRLRMARKVRRPWPNNPAGWGGTGSPGW